MKNKLSLKNRLFEIAAGVAIVGGAVMIAAPSLAADTTVTLTAANTFDQDSITVSEGDTVTFLWAGGFHDVAFADGVTSGAPAGIDGTTYTRTFDAAGTYAYVCTIHESSGMTGIVTVEAGATATTVAATDTTVAATATTVASGGGATATTVAATGGATGGSGSSSTARSQPFTGPEDSILPIAGLALVAGGIGIRLRLRKAS
jgi:plastocyanin